MNYTLADILDDNQRKLMSLIINTRRMINGINRQMAFDKLKRSKAAKIALFGTDEQKEAYRREQNVKFLQRKSTQKALKPKRRISLAKTKAFK